MNPRFWLLLAAGFAVRVCAAIVPGFLDDRRDFTTWAIVLAERGPLAIYGPGVDPAVDYSPGYLYVLWAVGLIHRAIGGGAIAWRALLEIVPIAGDLAIMTLLYVIAQRITTERNALILLALAAFAPPLWLDSAIWSQSDSIPIAFALIAIVAAIDDRLGVSWFALVAAIIVKPLVVVLAPSIAVLHVRSKSFWRSTGIALVASLALAYLATLPFTTLRSPVAVLRFLLERYVNGSGKAPYATGGGFTVYPLVTGFFTNDATRFGPLPFKTWGIILVVIALVAAAATLQRSLTVPRSEASRIRLVFGSATLSLLALFLFSTRMHERYLLPAIVFGSPLTLEDVPTAVAIGWLAVAFSINCVYSLHHFMGGSHHPVTIMIGRAISALNIIAFLVLWQRQLKAYKAM